MNKKKSNSNGSVSEIEIFRYLARRKFVFFVKYCIKNYKLKWFHEEICKKIQLMIDGKSKKKLMIFIPPQHGKSTLVSEALPAFILGIMSNSKVACSSYSSSLAQKMNRSVQRIIQSKEYRELFPNVKIGGKGYQANSNEFSINGKKGGLKAVGVNGSLTGFTVDFGIIDDPFKGMLEAYSLRQRERVWEWYRSVFKARLNNDTMCVLCHTRWHEDDLAGRILSSEEKDDWDVISIPAIREERKTIESDPRSVGEALWESFHAAKGILQEKEDSERRFNAVYQQHPSSAEGNIVKRDWVEYYDEEPYFEQIIQSWDCGIKSTETGSYVVGTIWGVTNNDIYLLAMDRGHYDFVDTVKHIKQAKEAYPTSVVLIEDKANGSAVMNQLRKEVTGMIPIIPTGSKEDRLSAASFIFEAGHVYFPNDTDWVSTVEDELFNFPLSKTDDICDTISQVIFYRYLKQKSKLFHMGTK